jgi:hypothetical protein
VVPARDRRVPEKEKGKIGMNDKRYASRILLAWVALVALQWIVGLLIPLRVELPGWQHLAWVALTDLIVVAAIAFVAVRSEWRGWRLGAALAAVPLTVALVNIVEALYYLEEAHLEHTRLILQAVLTYAVMALVWGRIFSAGREAPAPHFQPYGSRSLMQRAWRFVASDFAYLLGYLAAGMAIFPLVRDFYTTRTLPSPAVIFLLQLLVRGPLFVIVCVLLVRMAGLPRAKGAVAVGVVFTLVSGVAPLLLPSPYFPDAIRWVHFFEVTITNLVFGAIIAAMWGPPKT